MSNDGENPLTIGKPAFFLAGGTGFFRGTRHAASGTLKDGLPRRAASGALQPQCGILITRDGKRLWDPVSS
jgi:hypothetical protein